MTKSKTFWILAAFLSFCAAVFCGYSIYNRLTLHFAKDSLEIRPVPVPLPAPETAQETKTAPDPKPAGNAQPEEQKESPKKVKAVKTHFEYASASAKAVSVSGSFTSWKDVRMSKKGDLWTAEIYIIPGGSYLYHFTVDGKKTLAAGKPKAPVGESIIEVQ